jgi:hypothetical protein
MYTPKDADNYAILTSLSCHECGLPIKRRYAISIRVQLDIRLVIFWIHQRSTFPENTHDANRQKCVSALKKLKIEKSVIRCDARYVYTSLPLHITFILLHPKRKPSNHVYQQCTAHFRVPIAPSLISSSTLDSQNRPSCPFPCRSCVNYPLLPQQCNLAFFFLARPQA